MGSRTDVIQSEVIHSPPIATLPKYHLRAPPLNPSEPSDSHQYLPLVSNNQKLKAGSSPPNSSHGKPPGGYVRFPPLSHNLTEAELDPYFAAYEASTRTYEALVTGSIERVNRRLLRRLQELSVDYNELGARYNGFSLSETGSLASAVEKTGQAVDNTYIATGELARTLGSSFAEPIRESAQFAGVVQKVLKYRTQKRVQEEMTRDLLAQKRALLESLEHSEQEARRIEQFIHGANSAKPADNDDVVSIESADFPPTHSDTPSSPPQRARAPSTGAASSSRPPPPQHKKSASVSTPPSTNIFTRQFSKLGYAIHGVVDVDPERTRRDNIGKTRELIIQLEGAEKAVEKDVEEIGKAVLKDLRRFQAEKQEDLKNIMRVYAKVQIEWARKCMESWEEARDEVGKVGGRG